MEGTEPPQAGPPCSWSQKRRPPLCHHPKPAEITAHPDSACARSPPGPETAGYPALSATNNFDQNGCQKCGSDHRNHRMRTRSRRHTHCKDPVFQIVTTPFHSCRYLSVSVWTGPAPKNTKHDVQRPPVLRCSSGRGGQIFFNDWNREPKVI